MSADLSTGARAHVPSGSESGERCREDMIRPACHGTSYVHASMRRNRGGMAIWRSPTRYANDSRAGLVSVRTAAFSTLTIMVDSVLIQGSLPGAVALCGCWWVALTGDLGPSSHRMIDPDWMPAANNEPGHHGRARLGRGCGDGSGHISTEIRSSGGTPSLCLGLRIEGVPGCIAARMAPVLMHNVTIRASLGYPVRRSVPSITRGRSRAVRAVRDDLPQWFAAAIHHRRDVG